MSEAGTAVATPSPRFTGDLIAVGALFAFVVVATITGLQDSGSGIGFAGLAAVLFAVAAFMIMRRPSPAAASTDDLTRSDKLERLLAPTLAELEATRVETVRKANLRMSLLMPLGLGARRGICHPDLSRRAAFAVDATPSNSA